MLVRSILIFSLFVIALAPASQPVSAADHGLALSLQADETLVLSRSESWALKPQAGGALELELEYRFSNRLSLGAGFGWHGVLASGLSGGYLYRAFSGLEGRLRLGWSKLILPAAGDRPPLWAGLLGGGLARLDRYSYTELYFFYPGLFAGPFLELGPGPGSRFSFRLLLPLEWYFRRDMQVSASAGLAFAILYRPEGAPPGGALLRGAPSER